MYLCNHFHVVVELLTLGLTLCDPMDCSTPGLPILHYGQKFGQAHVHWVSDAIQPSHSLLPLFPNFHVSLKIFFIKKFFIIHQILVTLDMGKGINNFGEGSGTPLQYSCLENPMDGGAWWAAVHGVAKSRTRLSDFTFTFHSHALEKEMATHSSVLAWRIPGTGEPGGLPSTGSHRVGHNWSDLAAAASLPKLNKLIRVIWEFMASVARGKSLMGRLYISDTEANYKLWELCHSGNLVTYGDLVYDQSGFSNQWGRNGRQ